MTTTARRHANRRRSSWSLPEQCFDIGFRLGAGEAVPMPQQLRSRYELSLATAYRRIGQLHGYLRRSQRTRRRRKPGGVA